MTDTKTTDTKPATQRLGAQGDAAKIRILKFGSGTCGYCIEMRKSKLLQKFSERHPEIQIVEMDVGDDEGMTDIGTDYEKNYDTSEEYGVEALPTVIIEVRGAGEVMRLEGAPTMKELEKALKELLDGQRLSEKIPW